MEILCLKGGLGNQLFQLVAGLKYVKKKKSKKLTIYAGNLREFDASRDFMLKPFINNLDIEIVIKYRKNILLNRYFLKILSMLNLSINNSNYGKKCYANNCMPINIIDGYFQDIHCFDFSFLDRFRKSLDLEYSKEFNAKELSSLVNDDIIGLHIRGTDRVCESNFENIYEKVESYLSEDKQIICFTDDNEFAIKTLKQFKQQVIFISSMGFDDKLEFYIMSKLSRIIISNSNSTYSIFSRLLSENNSETIALRNTNGLYETSLIEILSTVNNVRSVY